MNAFTRYMGDSSASYIHLVHHLIETCPTFSMTKEECMEALSKHANIDPVISSTVWNELETENKEFFETYAESQRQSKNLMSEEETTRVIQKIYLIHQKIPMTKNDGIWLGVDHLKIFTSNQKQNNRSLMSQFMEKI